MRKVSRLRGLVTRDKILLFLCFFFITAGTGLVFFVEWHKRSNASAKNNGENKEEKKIPFPKGEEEGEYISEKDKMVMVMVPAGKFTMGQKGEEGAKEVSLPSFLIDKTEVTYKQYQMFLKENPEWVQGGNKATKLADGNYLRDWDNLEYPKGKDSHPVVWISWHAARAYAKWAGKRLPTQAEWEKAARGKDGLTYPWGNTPPTEALCNFGYHNQGTVPVTDLAEGASPFGCLHMAGNVWEWCRDFYELGNELGLYEQRVIRGGSWKNIPQNLQTHYSLGEGAKTCDSHIGFRCAWSAKAPEKE